MNKYKAYINDNYFQIKIKKIISFTSQSIINGNIINKELFINDYKNNINSNGIFSNSINIYLNKIIDEKDIYYYTNIFEELNYTNINILSTSNLLDNNVLIPNSNYYIIHNNNKYYYIYPFLLNEFVKYKGIKILRVLSNTILKDSINCKIYYYSNTNIFL